MTTETLPSDVKPTDALPSSGVTTVAAKPTPGTPEYDAAMLARAGDVTILVNGQRVVEEDPAVAVKAATDKVAADAAAVKAAADAKVAQDAAAVKSAADKVTLAAARAATEKSLNDAKAAQGLAKSRHDAAVAALAAKPEDVAAKAAVESTTAALTAAEAKVVAETGNLSGHDAAQAAAAKAVESAGLAYNEMATEFQRDGKLSTETYAKLAAAGFDRSVVDSHIAGQEALAHQIRQEVFALTGGNEAGYDAMTQWVVANIPAAEINKYNELVSGDINTAKLAVQGMWSRYQASVGFDPVQMEGGRNTGTTATAGGAAYANLQEMTKDMRDPRYAKDPKYRAMVEAKANRSTF